MKKLLIFSCFLFMFSIPPLLTASFLLCAHLHSLPILTTMSPLFSLPLFSLSLMFLPLYAPLSLSFPSLASSLFISSSLSGALATGEDWVLPVSVCGGGRAPSLGQTLLCWNLLNPPTPTLTIVGNDRLLYSTEESYYSILEWESFEYGGWVLKTMLLMALSRVLGHK